MSWSEQPGPAAGQPPQSVVSRECGHTSVTRQRVTRDRV